MQREVIWILCSVLCLLLWYILSIVNWTVRRKSLILESILIIPGALLCGAMLSIGSHVTLQNFDVAIGYQQLHSPIQTQHLLSVGLPIVLCVLGLLLTGMQKLTKRLPAGVYLLLMGCILVGDGMLLLGMIQLGKQFTMDFYEVITLVVPFYRFAVFLYPINLLLLSVRRIRQCVKTLYQRAQDKQTSAARHARCWLLQTKCGIMLQVVLAGVLTVVGIWGILWLCGQSADGWIRAFTETADWTFSKHGSYFLPETGQAEW